MQLAWASDIHLNFISNFEIQNFLTLLNKSTADAILITGDIAEAPTVELMLHLMSGAIHKDIYFVLGNHDFYHGNIHDVRQGIIELCKTHSNLHYLSNSAVIELDKDTAIIGHDSWYDCKAGSFMTSGFSLSDFHLINEYKQLNYLSKEDIFAVSNEIVLPGIQHISYNLQEALKKYKKVICATHVPPFIPMCKYNGKGTGPEALPFFCCPSLGDAILDQKEKFPNKIINIFSGHTHFDAEFHLDNMHCYTAAAKYGFPSIYNHIST